MKLIRLQKIAVHVKKNAIQVLALKPNPPNLFFTKAHSVPIPKITPSFSFFFST